MTGPRFLDVLGRNPSAAVGLALICGFVALAVAAPLIAPYGPFEVAFGPDRSVPRLAPPSARNWFGTTNQGMDVFSQLVWGSRVALTVGLLSALGSVVVGTLIGLVSGYFGGWIDDVLMRLTDVAFGIPFLPFALVVIAMAEPSLGLVILLVIFFLWRTTARVIRAQTLSLKERPFVWAARAAGAGHWAILFRHIAPNVLPLSFLYVAVGVQTGVMLEAALSFLGFGDPHAQSWGIMLNAAFRAGAMRTAWWWVLPPGVALSLFVMAIFMVGRAYEEILNPRLRAV
ncbi:MAG: ABC transporter permease [Alphaproteobacteria bacterium]|nr:ABC transporter permease [Alphaproteobacteria bacterium]